MSATSWQHQEGGKEGENDSDRVREVGCKVRVFALSSGENTMLDEDDNDEDE